MQMGQSWQNRWSARQKSHRYDISPVSRAEKQPICFIATVARSAGPHQLCSPIKGQTGNFFAGGGSQSALSHRTIVRYECDT